MTHSKLGQLVKARRGDLGLTLSHVGAELGLANGNFVGMVERGERMPSDDRLLDLARVLGLDGRELLAIKYQATHGAAAALLLRPPSPKHPRLRRLLLSTCTNRPEMEAEFGRGEHTAVEHLVYQALMEYVILPALQSDKQAPRRVRDRVARHRKKHPDQAIDPWVFEEEAQAFLPWLRSHFESWSFELATLTLTIRHSSDDGDVSTIPLIDRELRQRMIARVEVETTRGSGLADLLRAEGLPDGDVEEILELVEFKKLRARRSAS